MCLHSKIFFTNGFLGSKPANHKKKQNPEHCLKFSMAYY